MTFDLDNCVQASFATFHLMKVSPSQGDTGNFHLLQRSKRTAEQISDSQIFFKRSPAALRKVSSVSSVEQQRMHTDTAKIQTQSNAASLDREKPRPPFPFHSLGEVNFIVSRLSTLKEKERKVSKFFQPLNVEAQSLHSCDLSVKLKTWNCEEHHR